MENSEFSIRHYPLMKDSGIDWIGEIPMGWEIKKLKYVANLKSGDNLTSNQIKEDGAYPVYGGNGLRGYYHEFTHEGDFILIGRQGALCGNINYPANKFWATDHAVVVEPLSNYKLVWLGEVLRIMNLNQYSVAAAQPGLSVEAICNLFIPWPLLEEQTPIANFLDRKTAEIDALIAQKERLLELYEEEKTAIINHAVTEGLDPNAELKDSGVEWLGKIPARWKLKNLKFVTKHGLQNGIFKKALDFGSGIKLINVGDIYTHNFLIDENSLERVACTASEVTKYEANTGDIFFVRSSLKREGIGKTACLEGRNESIVFECHLIKIAPKDIAHQYLNYYLNSDLLRHKLISLSITTTMSTISQDAIGNLEVVIPSSREQTAIVQHIEAETTRINAKITKTQRIIELQKEYRTALISEVVTGKIKVPELPTQEASA